MSIPSPTTAVTLDLVTVRTIVTGLGWLGITWTPLPEFSGLGSQAGLYAWTIGRGMDSNKELLDRAVAYLGVGEGAAGVVGRLAYEKKWVIEDATHGHGRAMHLLQGQAAAGLCQRDTSADLTWLDRTLKNDEGARALRDWLSSPTSVTSQAEQIGVRIALHIGDVAPPVNSHYAGAWDSDAPRDWAGYAVALRLCEAEAPRDQEAPHLAGARPETQSRDGSGQP